MNTRLAFAIACSLGIVLAAGPAQAADHLLRITEVMLSTGGGTDARFVEISDSAAEPLPNAPYRLEIYDAGATLVGMVTLTGLSAPAPFLVSTAAADTALGSTGDAVLDVALPADGQACVVRATDAIIHCVAWGCVTSVIMVGSETAPSPPDGMSIQRQGAGGYQLAAPTPDAANSTGTMAAACPTAGDAGTDGAVPDAATDSGAPPADTGTPPADTGPIGTDSGTTGTDTGTGADTGTGDGDGGCSIHGGSSPGSAPWVALCILALLARRRRRSR